MMAGPSLGMLKRKVYRDGGDVTHPVFMPQSSKDFQLLSIGTPSNLWLCQQASGNLSDSIGAVTLTANGAPTYQNAKSPWAKKTLNFTAVASQRFQVGAASGPNPATQSVAWLFYFFLNGHPAASTAQLVIAANGQTTTGLGVIVSTGGLLRANCVNVYVNGTVDYNDGLIHPCCLVYNRTAGSFHVFTDKEDIAGTYNAGTVDAAKGLGGTGAGTPTPGGIMWCAAVGGATAEGWGRNTIAKLGWTITGY